MATVPSQYQPYVSQAAKVTGLPESVVAAQAQAESGFNASAVSPTGAEGWLQFEPQTFNAYAGQAGVPVNTEFNVANETKVYDVYMNSLLKQEGGSVFRALEAYNAGPGNLAAGQEYANSILRNAGQSQSLKSRGGAQSATLTDFPGGGFDPLNWPGDVYNAANNAVGNALTDVGNSIINSIFSALGIPSLKDLLQRLGLIILGAVLVVVGLRMLGTPAVNVTVPSQANKPAVNEPPQ